MPYCQEHALYNQFKLDEPWDSEHNKKLIPRMPRIYASSNAALTREGKTTFLAPVGKDTAFPGMKAVRIQDITDGASITILLVDAEDARAVPWTKPEDLAIDLDKPTVGLRTFGERGFLTLLVDGSLRYLPPTIDKATLKALFTIAGNEMVTPP